MNHLAKLPDGELQIMQALWKCSIPAEKRKYHRSAGPETTDRFNDPADRTFKTVRERICQD